VLSVSLLAMLFVSVLALAADAGAWEANYDESKIPPYTLPDPLVMNDGTPVKTAADWPARRAEILALFESQMFGKMPGKPERQTVELLNEDSAALDGQAYRREVRITVTQGGKSLAFDLLIYLPPDAPRPVPVFLMLNFFGNHSISTDPGIHLNENWFRNSKDKGTEGNRATEASRGASASRWPVEHILSRGYGVATIYYGDLDPDFDDGFQNGLHSLFYRPGQTRPEPDEWGSIGAWAWGLSRAMDYFETTDDIDAKQVAVAGHSRLGKTSLWAGATDERFAIVISNDSGCGGAALSRRAIGETVWRINNSFPHWFCDNFTAYNDKEGELPFDQHELIALMAPRPVYVASAQDDKWADPKGEFLSCAHADPVYKLLDLDGLPGRQMPGVNEPVAGTIGYHMRDGGHDVKLYDWERYMDFADRHFGR